MEIRFYLMPVMVLEIGGEIKRVPSYVKSRFNPGGIPVNRYSTRFYGSIDVCIIAVETDTATHDLLASQADVIAAPTDLETTASPGELSALETYLEAGFVPANWLLPNMTWREILRTVTSMFLFMGKLTHLTGNVSPLDWGITLNTQWRDLTAEQQDAIYACWSDYGWDSAVIKSNSTMRALLKYAADQHAATPVQFGLTQL